MSSSTCTKCINQTIQSKESANLALLHTIKTSFHWTVRFQLRTFLSDASSIGGMDYSRTRLKTNGIVAE